MLTGASGGSGRTAISLAPDSGARGLACPSITPSTSSTSSTSFNLVGPAPDIRLTLSAHPRPSPSRAGQPG
ncbi:hypothetical protein NGM37_24770, partial [Streptomyces sp. TRM76130]|nr:hypothetical protein [Streptomyces sp. TRM76130]